MLQKRGNKNDTKNQEMKLIQTWAKNPGRIKMVIEIDLKERQSLDFQDLLGFGRLAANRPFMFPTLFFFHLSET